MVHACALEQYAPKPELHAVKLSDVDAELLPSTASRKLPEWVAKLQDAVALNCCKGDASGERGASQWHSLLGQHHCL